jgi:hypothetical protein
MGPIFWGKLLLFVITTQHFRSIQAQNATTVSDSELWRLAIDFLTAFNSQRPIKRLIAFYGGENGFNHFERQRKFSKLTKYKVTV